MVLSSAKVPMRVLGGKRVAGKHPPQKIEGLPVTGDDKVGKSYPIFRIDQMRETSLPFPDTPCGILNDIVFCK